MALVTRADRYRVLGFHNLTSSFTTAATHTTAQDEGLTTSVTYQGNRYLRVTFSGHPYASGGAQGVQISILRGATSIAFFQTESLSATTPISKVFQKTIAGPATGATETFKVQVSALTANTAVRSYGDANFTRQLLVEDLGPQ